MCIKILNCLRDAVKRKHLAKWAETAGLFCMTMHLHIAHWWSKSTLPSTIWQISSIYHIPRTCHNLSPVSMAKKWSEMTTVHKYQGKSHCKTDERSDRGVEK
jgi:hypothetical protein